MLKGFDTKDEAEKFASAWSKEYHVDCKIEDQSLK